MEQRDKPRRSAGMRGSPAAPAPEHRALPTDYKSHPEKPQVERVSTSPYAKPKVLMGEVVAPVARYAAGREGAQQIAAKREALRTFMTVRGLRPSQWAAQAHVPANELLAFLTGKSRGLAVDAIARLAAAANTTPEAMFTP